MTSKPTPAACTLGAHAVIAALDVVISTLEAAQRGECDVVAHCPKIPSC